MSSPFRPLAIVVCLCLALLLPRTIAHAQGTQVFIDNGTWRVLSAPFWGGAITGIEPSGGGTDFIDNGLPDTGRSLQVSLYQSGQTYSDGWPCDGGTWGWNPVQAGTMSSGSCTTSGATVSSGSNSGGHLTSTVQAKHWNPNLGTSNVVISQDAYFVSGYSNVIRIDYFVTNNESFTVSAAHEAPVMYVSTGVVSTKVTYDGGSPWSNDSVSVVGDGVTSSSEPWIAATATNPNSSPSTTGIALYVPDHDGSNNFFNFASVQNAIAVQGWRNMSIGPSSSVGWTVYVVVGSFSAIRSSIYSLAGH